MRSTRNTLPLAYSSTGSAILLLAVPFAAMAAEQSIKQFDLSSARWWAILAFVQVVTIIGYMASSLSQWAGWIDGTVLQRMTILQGAIAALMAGNMSYFLGLHYAGLSEVMALMSAGAGGFGGDRFITPVLQRMFGKATGLPPEK